MRSRRWLVVLLAALASASCQPADRDILVRWRDGRLVVDFPWSLWRWFGLQDRTYCIRRIELFDATRVQWALDMIESGSSCAEVTMPIEIGQPLGGFASQGTPELRRGIRYGVGISGIGNGRVDFVLREPGREPINHTDWRGQLEGPCGSYWGRDC